MIYEFKCKNCGNVKSVKIPMSEISNAEIICDCGQKMVRNWKASLNVPDHMRAAESQEMAWVQDRLKNRPSGKRRVLY